MGAWRRIRGHARTTWLAIGTVAVVGVAAAAAGVATTATGHSLASVKLPSGYAHSQRAKWAIEDLPSADIAAFEHWPTAYQRLYLVETTSFAWNPQLAPPQNTLARERASMKALADVTKPEQGPVIAFRLMQQQVMQAARQDQHLVRTNNEEAAALARSGSGYAQLVPTGAGWASTWPGFPARAIGLTYLSQLPSARHEPTSVFACVAPGATPAQVHLVAGAVLTGKKSVDEYLAAGTTSSATALPTPKSEIVLQPWTLTRLPLDHAAPSHLLGMPSGPRREFAPPHGINLTHVVAIMPRGIVLGTSTGGRIYFSLATDRFHAQIPTTSAHGARELCEPVTAPTSTTHQ